MQTMFYYSFDLAFLKFKNRLLLLSLKNQELDKKKPLGLYLNIIFKLCKEEFLSPDSEINNEAILFPARLK